MRRRVAFVATTAALISLTLALVAGTPGSAHGGHKDLQINRTLTEFSSGPFDGDTVLIYGSGTWNTVTGAVQAGGMLIHRDNGSLVARAPWRATGVESFESFGTDLGGFIEGGVLVLDVRVYTADGPVNLDDFTITCLVGPDVPAGAVEGVTIPSLGLDEEIQGPHRFTVFENI